MNPENALVSRRLFPIEQDRVVVEERWDLSHPECPLIPNPWHRFAPLQSPNVRQVIMTREEFENSKMRLKHLP